MGAHSDGRLVVSLRVMGAIVALYGFVPLCCANELDAEQTKLVEEGAKLFAHRWQTNDPISRVGDGLGPVYNETSCTGCHSQGGVGGGGTADKNVQLLASSLVALRSRRPNDKSLQKQVDQIHPGLRTSAAVVFHRFGTSTDYTRWRESLFARLPDSTSLPSQLSMRSAEEAPADGNATARQFKETRLAKLRSRTSGFVSISERNATALFGDGLIDQIPDAVIKAQMRVVEDLEPLDTVSRRTTPQFSIQGRYVSLSDGRVGKFGWKAQQATLAEFTMSACAVEVGLEVPGNSQLPDPLSKGTNESGLDMDRGDCDALIAFVNHLPAPRRETPADSNGETVMIGEIFFNQVGCADCHKSRLGDIDGLYSDLLLHNMGQALADSAVYYGTSVPTTAGGTGLRGTPATAAEWRTPPLWGAADSAPYLHDGRARTLKEAILLHDGQATDSANRFSALADDEQAAVLTFLRSLKAPQAIPATEMVTRAAPR